MRTSASSTIHFILLVFFLCTFLGIGFLFQHVVDGLGCRTIDRNIHPDISALASAIDADVGYVIL